MISDNVGSGETYTTLQGWWTARKDSADDLTATLTSDISDTVPLTGGTNNKTVTIQSDATRRTVTHDAGSGSIISVNDAVITTFTIQNINLNGNSEANKTGLEFVDMAAAATASVRNMIMYDNANYGIWVNTGGAAAFDVTAENCLIYDAGADGVYVSKIDAANTTTLTNCGFAGAANFNVDYTNNANITMTIENCWAMAGTTGDFRVRATAVTSIINSVSSDTSATDASWDTSTGCAVSKTSYTNYFTNYAGKDFTLKDEDQNLDWGISGNGPATPADDLLGVTRTNDDIGPYEYVAAATTTSPMIRIKTDQPTIF